MNTHEATVLVQSSSNLLRMIILTISQSSLNMDHVGSKCRSAGQIIEKPCEHSRGHSFSLIFIKLAQNNNLDNISVKFKYGSYGVKKNISAGQTIEKPYEHSCGHSFSLIFIKLAQNDHLDNISVKFEYGFCRIKN